MPLAVAELSGAAKKNPQRYRARAAVAAKTQGGLGPPPQEWVDGAETNGRCKSLLSIWQEIVAQDVLKVLNVSHRLLVENTCILQYKVRRASAGYGKATSGDFAQLAANLAKMGMTPADSARVSEAVRLRDQEGAEGKKSGAGWGELVG